MTYFDKDLFLTPAFQSKSVLQKHRGGQAVFLQKSSFSLFPLERIKRDFQRQRNQFSLFLCRNPPSPVPRLSGSPFIFGENGITGYTIFRGAKSYEKYRLQKKGMIK